MKIEVLTEKDNPLLKRKQLVLSIEYDSSTPSKAEMQLALSKQFSAEPNRVEIKKIISSHGKATGKIWANIWEDKEIPIYGKKEEKKEEAPATPVEEAPAEPAKEETPKEEPKEPKEEPKEEVKEEPKEEKAEDAAPEEK